MRIPVFHCSTQAESRSLRLAEAAHHKLKLLDAAGRLIDLREKSLPLADAKQAATSPEIRAVQGSIQRGPAVVLAIPVKGHDISAAARNLIEATGDVWKDKIVALALSGKSRTGYMAGASVVTSLLFEHRCLIVPRYVYASSDDFSRGGVIGGELDERVNELCALTVHLAKHIDLSRPVDKKKQRVRRTV